MTIDLYMSLEDPRKANKTPQLVAANVSCKPAEPCSLLTPRLLLNYSATYSSTNYIYIQDFDRFYFAELTLKTGKELQLDCKLDAYSSFDLSRVQATVIRSETAGVNYCVDSKLPIDPNRFGTYGEPFVGDIDDYGGSDAHHYILVLNQGGVNNGT